MGARERNAYARALFMLLRPRNANFYDVALLRYFSSEVGKYLGGSVFEEARDSQTSREEIKGCFASNTNEYSSDPHLQRGLAKKGPTR